MKQFINIPWLLLPMLSLLIACSAATDTRYEDKNETNKENDTETELNRNVEEDFDITPYQTTIEIEEKEPANQFPASEIWYDYEDSVTTSSKNIIGTTDGYRVLVVTADDMEKANEVRSEIYFKTNYKEVYISFEPPFYKVKVGDFTSLSEANDLKFKLNQLGYNEARVVKETVNIFE